LITRYLLNFHVIYKLPTADGMERMLQKNENLQAELDSAFGGVGSYDVSNSRSGKTKAICILKNYCIIEEAPKPRRLPSPRNLDFADDANRLRLRPRVPSATATWQSATGLPAATAGGIRGPRGAAAGEAKYQEERGMAEVDSSMVRQQAAASAAAHHTLAGLRTSPWVMTTRKCGWMAIGTETFMNKRLF